MKRTKQILIIVICVVLGAIGAAFFLSRPTGTMRMEGITVTASADGIHGIPSDSSFIIRSKYWTSAQAVEQMLRIQPALGEYELTGFGRKFTLKPAQPLQRNTVYTFQVLSGEGAVVRSFAFQSESDLQISSVYPGDKDYYISPETGIEITFNTKVEQISDHFTILPQVPGTFEVQDYTVIFRPNDPLEPDYVYQVTLQEGLSAVNGMQLQEDYTFSFETASQKDTNGSLLLTNQFIRTFVPGDTVTMPMWGGPEWIDTTFDLTVHQYSSIDTYIHEVKNYNDFRSQRYGKKTTYHVNVQEMEEVFALQEKLIAQEDTRDYMALFPNDLAPGYYVATVTGSDEENRDQFVQMLFQVSEISLYAQSSDGEVYGWLNSTATGKPIAQATMLLEDDTQSISGETGEDGVVRLATEEMEAAYLTILQNEKPVFFDYVQLNSQLEDSLPLPEQYYTAIYTDRELYQPSDRIEVWGVIQPRADQQLPGVVTAALSRSWYREDTAPVYQAKLELDAQTGIFRGTLPISSLAADGYMLSILDPSGNVYMQKYIQVRQYQKPEYTIAIIPDKEAYFADETVTFQVNAKFYDGTPFSNGQLQFSSGYLKNSSTTEEGTLIRLDENGQAEVKLTFSPSLTDTSYIGWTPTTIDYWITGAQEESVYSMQSGYITVFPSKTALKAEFDSSSPDTLRIQTALFDSSKWGGPQTIQPLRSLYFEDPFAQYAGTATSEDVTIRLYRTELIQTVIDEGYYDYINKVSVPTYRYTTDEKLVKTVQVRTVNGSVVIDQMPVEDISDTVSYRAEIEFSNQMGSTITVRASTNQYQPRASALSAYKSYAFAAGSATSAQIGEAVTLGLYCNENKVANQGSIFYAVSQRGVIDTATFTTNSETITMDETYLPNIQITGAYFDGRHIYPVQTYHVSYKYDSQQLDLELTTDQDSYQPGEQATVTATVKDAQGNPVEAQLVMGVVDEALFALAEQHLDLAEMLYQSVYYPSTYQIVSYKQPENLSLNRPNPNTAGGGMDEAEADRGGSDAIRKKFVDTADFQTAKTDAEGVAVLTVELPDNITSWRITAGAVTTDLKAGSNTKQMIATKPFYLRTLITPTYLVDDNITVAVSSVGSALDAESSVAYTMTLLNESNVQLEEKTFTAKAGARAFVNFDKQQTGVYTVLIEGRCGSYNDMVQKSFTVAEKGLTAPVFKTLPLQEATSINSVRYPVKLVVYDERMRPFMQGIELLTSKYSSRTEILAASYRAKQIAADLLDDSTERTVYKDARLDQMQETGIKPLPAAQADPATTAKMLIAAPELIAYPDMAVAYLQTVLTDSTQNQHNKVMAQAGLAAAGEPVLLDVQMMLEQEDLTLCERLYLGAGLAKLGDYTSAEKIYKSIHKQIASDMGVKYVQGDTLEERYQNTAAALMLTSIIGHEDAGSLMDYFLQVDKDRAQIFTVTYELEALTYLTNFRIPSGADRGQFSYQNGDETSKITLGNTGVQILALSYEEMQNAAFKAHSGELYAAVQYTDYITSTEIKNPVATIEKTFTPVQGGALKTAQKVRVDITITIDPDAPTGSYQIYDQIPSGMRYLSSRNGYWDSSAGSLYNMEEQTMQGYLYWSREDFKEYNAASDELDARIPEQPIESPMPVEQERSNVYTFTYYVNTALPGEYTSEGTYIALDNESSFCAQGEAQTVQIKEP